MDSVAELIAEVLADLGVGHAFGVVGSGNFQITNALRTRGVGFVAARHEGGAASMADGYARLSGRPAVLSVHQGCGLTNAITGIGEAAKSRTPLIVLAADTAGSAVRSNFRIDQDALAVSVGAVAERVHSAASAVADVTRAYRTAVEGRRTVVLSLPLDVQAQPAPPYQRLSDPAQPEPFPWVPPFPVRPAQEAVAALAALLASAQRPVFVAGRGARSAGLEISSLAARSGALLATSAVANGLFRHDEFDLGISGGFSTPLTADLIEGADLIVGWGCALNMWTMRHGSLIGEDAVVVQVDDDHSALGAHRPISLGVLGDCAATARDVSEALPSTKPGYRTSTISQKLAQSRWWNDTPTPDLSSDTRIDPRVLSAALDDLLPTERMVSIDSGNFMGYPAAYLRVPDENGFCFTQAFQSVGLGLASGLGAALAQPSRLAVVATGDGGFLMGISELETAVRLGIPLVVVIYDDAAYGAEVHHFGPDADLGAVTFPDTDLAAMATGFGAKGVTVRSVDDLADVKDWLATPQGVLVIDAKIADDGGAWWLAEAFRGH
ncbi:acetolactate synthase I/II/III large subunit [Kineosporia sp. NBRC 101677]|uniref:thiamine pyrophosphate-binding protein n=1 Tax=Kineosporia sp. NBRC 101677 TaxID=3032197 RepID=UPI0024A60508|nr:thiamine pyrophosphate-binding protein [Kineosporia sp. NBRC 101677]GLY15169.1 acetolactate synthase I/II/III large subunit [Kineosporia sp. NBRC 101677]